MRLTIVAKLVSVTYGNCLLDFVQIFINFFKDVSNISVSEVNNHPKEHERYR